MLLASLSINVGVTGTGSVIASLGQINQAINSTASVASGSAGNAIRGFIQSFDELRMVGQIIGQAASAITGVGIAAEMIDIEAKITAVVGSASEARKALEGFRQIGVSTIFDTREVAAFGATLLSLGQGVPATQRQLTALLDATSMAGINRADLLPVMTNLIQIRGQRTPNYIDLKQMMGRAPGMGAVIGKALGRGPMDINQVTAFAKSMSGREFFDFIVKAGETIARGAAAARALSSPLAFIANVFESMSFVMEPTGRIIIALLMPLGIFVQSVSMLLGAINRGLGGVPGLIALIYGVFRGWVYFVGIGRFVQEEITKLNAALLRLAGSARTATGATGAAAATGAAGGLGGLFRGKGGIIGLIAGMAASYAGFKIGGDWGEVLSNTGAATGLGAMFGPWGAVIGGALGAIGTLGYQLFSQKKDVASATDPLVDALDKNTEAQKERTELLGGGTRARGVTSQMQLEYALYHAMGI